MSRVFTREEFHALVWSKPMTQLAREFALSDVALHKICRKHDIPNPPAGWWARKAAGKKVKQTPLPKATGAADRIMIAGGELRREPDAVAAVREQARVLASTLAPEPQTSPIVERTIAKLRKATPGPTGLVPVNGRGLIKCQVDPASIERLAAALPPIIAAAAQQGFSLEASEDAACFARKGETIAFSITETVRRVKHELTEKEQAEAEKWRKHRDQQPPDEQWRWTFRRPRFQEWDWHPTGQLSLELEHIYVLSGSSPRRSFRDARVQRLETMVSDIAVGIAVIAAAKQEQRLRREAEQQRIEEQRRSRELALRANQIEERRLLALDSILGEIERYGRLRRLLDDLRTRTIDTTDPRVAEFIRWSERHLAQLDTALTPGQLGSRFGDQHLFGEDDDHAFRMPGWY